MILAVIQRLVYVFLMCLGIRTINTVRKINEISGNKKIAALLIGIDTTLFLLVFKNLITDDLTVPVVGAMALGYISGYYLGAFVEEKMAIGKVLVTIKISKKYSKQLHKKLRDSGFVFTRSKRVYSQKNKLKKIYRVIIFRKELPKLRKVLKGLKVVGYVEPLKKTFGRKLVTSGEYLRDKKRLSS